MKFHSVAIQIDATRQHFFCDTVYYAIQDGSKYNFQSGNEVGVKRF